MCARVPCGLNLWNMFSKQCINKNVIINECFNHVLILNLCVWPASKQANQVCACVCMSPTKLNKFPLNNRLFYMCVLIVCLKKFGIILHSSWIVVHWAGEGEKRVTSNMYTKTPVTTFQSKCQKILTLIFRSNLPHTDYNWPTHRPTDPPINYDCH